jgi:hypothetical protein
MEITLTPDIEQALLEQARQRGTTPEELALESLRRQFVTSEQAQELVEAQGTLADLLGDSIAVLHSHEHVPGGARMSEATSETFAKALLDKRIQGRL